MTGGSVSAPNTSRQTVGRAATRTGVVTAASRVIGLGRVLVIAAVLGTTYLGNTFQASNSISNVLFDLLAAGGLSAVLVPAFVRAADDAETERLADAILGVATAVLGAVAIAGVVAAPWIARVLTAGAPAAIAASQRELATFLVRCFVPQIVLYAFGAVAAGVLHARRRFLVVAAAPIANTVVMVVCLVAFRLHAGAHPGLDLDRGSRVLLAAAGTGGVVAFVGTLVVPAWRSGVRLRPRWARDRDVIDLLAHSGWGILLNSLAGAVMGAVIVAGNVVEGGVVAFQVAFVLFLAPYAVLAQPLHSAALPEFAHDAVAAPQRVDATLRWALESIVVLVAPVAAMLVVAAGPAVRVVGFGLDARGVHLVGLALGGLAPGLVPYSVFLLLARASYARGDSRSPAVAALVGAVMGVGIIVAVRLSVHTNALLVGLGLAHTAAFTVAATVLGVALARRGSRRLVSGVATRSCVLAVVIAGMIGALRTTVHLDGRLAAFAWCCGVALVCGGAGLLVARRRTHRPETV